MTLCHNRGMQVQLGKRNSNGSSMKACNGVTSPSREAVVGDALWRMMEEDVQLRAGADLQKILDHIAADSSEMLRCSAKAHGVTCGRNHSPKLARRLRIA